MQNIFVTVENPAAAMAAESPKRVSMGVDGLKANLPSLKLRQTGTPVARLAPPALILWLTFHILTIAARLEPAPADAGVTVQSNQATGTPGVFPIRTTKGDTFTGVKGGETYSFKVLGYQSVGTTASLYVKTNLGDLIWPGVTLPVGAANENWVTASITIPAGATSLQVGVKWSTPAIGNTIYINRVALYKTDFEYNYFITDQVGSPRVVLQTTPATLKYTATMEPNNQATESTQFQNMDVAYMATSPGNETPGGSYALRLNNVNRIGASKSIKVYPGDVVNATVTSFYTASSGFTKTPYASMMATAALAFGGVSGGIGDPGSIYSTIGNTPQNSGIIGAFSPDNGTSQPSAFLNYILFDKEYKPLAGQSIPVPATPNAKQTFSMPTITAQEIGYVFIYLSYDNSNSGANMEVFFDDLKITHQESPVIQVNNYYPFGMVTYAWLREGEIDNANLFQGKELIAQTGWHDFGSRMYYGDLGRWFSTDPQKQFSSPYMAMGNMPMMGRDPDGEFFWFVAIGAIVGGYAGASIQQGTMDITQWKSDWYKGAITGAFIGAAAGLGVAAAIGPGGVSGITVGNSTLATAELTKAWGITSTAIQGANVNMALTAISGGDLDNVYKSGLVGAASGLFASTGGFGMINAWGAQSKAAQFMGRQLYQGIGTAGTSIGNNWAAGRDLLSSVTVGVGPVNLTFGKGEQLIQLCNNLGNAAVNALGLANLTTGKIIRDNAGNIISNTRGSFQFDWTHLTPVYSKGIIDKTFGGAFGAHAVLSPHDMLPDVLPHELHHVWQSRAMGDAYLINHIGQGVFPLLMGRSPLLSGNYFEAQAYLRFWFN